MTLMFFIYFNKMEKSQFHLVEKYNEQFGTINEFEVLSYWNNSIM